MGKGNVVVVESGEGRTKLDLLSAGVSKAGLPELLDEAREKSGKQKSEFRVVIKPNLAMFFKDIVTITDPELVEDLVDIIHDLGYTNVVICEAQNTFVKWLHNREMTNIAKAAGYRFKTSKGRAYEVLDLGRDGAPYDFPPEFSLCGTPISRLWQEADFRISFAKNKTHEEYLYTLCLKNLLGAITLDDKHLHFHSRLKVWDVCLEIYKEFPVHFNVIDAYVSNHGNVGSQVTNPLETHTIIASADTILADWAGAVKMGTDPYLSPLNARALKEIGLPVGYEVVGSLEPYEGWKNVHPLISRSFFHLDEAEAITRIFWPASFVVDTELFPWKGRIYKWLNAAISPLWARVDKSTILLWSIIYINYFFVMIFFFKRSWRTLVNQKQLRRKELPVNVPPGKFTGEDYEGLPAFMKPLEDTIDSTPIKNGACHTFVDGAILLRLERDVDYNFDEFVEKVDISKSVTYMKDFIGGRSVQVKLDSRGRCIHQQERTVFLPQPNLFILIGGKVTDVTKIERIEYDDDSRKMIWKTVLSDNATAYYDDGTVTFERTKTGTRIRVLIRQKFANPYLLGWLRMNDFPLIRRLTMVPAFIKFFEKTIDNYCNIMEDKYRPLGRPWVMGNHGS